MADTSKKPKQKYRALVGMDYPPDRRVEAGEIVDDIPVVSLGWLLEQGKVEKVSEDEAKAASKSKSQGAGEEQVNVA